MQSIYGNTERKTIVGGSLVLAAALLAPNFARRSPAEENAMIQRAEPSRRVLDSFLLLGGEKKPVEGADFQISFTTSGYGDGTVFANASSMPMKIDGMLLF